MIGAADTEIKTNECLACAKAATFSCFHMLGLTRLDSELVDLPVVYRYLEPIFVPAQQERGSPRRVTLNSTAPKYSHGRGHAFPNID